MGVLDGDVFFIGTCQSCGYEVEGDYPTVCEGCGEDVIPMTMEEEE